MYLCDSNVLATSNITGPDNILIKITIEVVVAAAGFLGVYGIRDALRRLIRICDSDAKIFNPERRGSI